MKRKEDAGKPNAKLNSQLEVLSALNSPDVFILAIVEVDGDKTRTTYWKRPFRNQLDFTAKARITTSKI